MRYQAEIETRPHPPIEIPRCEMILPIPREWFDLINSHGLNPEIMLQNLLSFGGQRTYAAELRDDFPNVFESLSAYPIPQAEEWDIVRAVIPLRVELFECLQAASKLVGKSVHEVACRILARQIPQHIELRDSDVLSRYLASKKRSKAVAKSVPAALAGKIIPFRPELAARQ